MENTKPLLSVRDLKVYFDLDEGTVKSVDGISFDAYEGKVVGIVGESGCGKSVTMKSILRIVEKPGRIVEGDILLQKRDNPDEYLNLVKMKENGKEIRAVRGGEIALIPQEPMSAFSPIHTIGDQITEAILLHNPVDKEEARRICIESLKSVGMSMPEKRLDSYSWQLSGGLRQRAIIAMALVCKPRLLIADEPTTALDVTIQAQILELIKDLQEKTGVAVLHFVKVLNKQFKSNIRFFKIGCPPYKATETLLDAICKAVVIQPILSFHIGQHLTEFFREQKSIAF